MDKSVLRLPAVYWAMVLGAFIGSSFCFGAYTTPYILASLMLGFSWGLTATNGYINDPVANEAEAAWHTYADQVARESRKRSLKARMGWGVLLLLFRPRVRPTLVSFLATVVLYGLVALALMTTRFRDYSLAYICLVFLGHYVGGSYALRQSRRRTPN